MVDEILGLNLFEPFPVETAALYDISNNHRSDLSCGGGTVERNSSYSKVRLLASGKHRYLAECYVPRSMA